MNRKLSAILSTVLLCALCAAPAHALEYAFDAPADYPFQAADTADCRIGDAARFKREQILTQYRQGRNFQDVGGISAAIKK